MGEFENIFGILQRPLTYMHCNAKLHTRINPLQCDVIVLNMLIETVQIFEQYQSTNVRCIVPDSGRKHPNSFVSEDSKTHRETKKIERSCSRNFPLIAFAKCDKTTEKIVEK